jgi:hypothetical protein
LLNFIENTRRYSTITVNEANFSVRRNTNHKSKEMGISFDFCTDNSKECIKRNKFYNQIRKNLRIKKYENYYKKKIEIYKQL